MYSNTRFGQIMTGLPRRDFQRWVDRLEADKHSKGFGCWDQLLAMIYGQLSGVRSLRELEAGFNSQSAHHYHLGTRSLHRSTLADANRRRDCRLFEQCLTQLLGQLNRKARREIKDLLYLLDSTAISLTGRGYEWAQSYRNNVSAGLKAHLMILADQQQPVYAQITPMKTSDIRVGREIPLQPKATYVFDKGYYDYNWWYEIEKAEAKFVTRLKKNVRLKVDTTTPGNKGSAIIEDAQIRMSNRYVKSQTRRNAYYNRPLRRITVQRPDHDTPLVLVTNDFERDAQQIAALYKRRWGIELFFKWLKQNLKIKRFMGRSENAVRIQLYTAIIAYVLVHMHARACASGKALYLVLASLKTGLFERPHTSHYLDEQRKLKRRMIAELQPQLPL